MPTPRCACGGTMRPAVRYEADREVAVAMCASCFREDPPYVPLPLRLAIRGLTATIISMAEARSRLRLVRRACSWCGLRRRIQPGERFCSDECAHRYAQNVRQHAVWRGPARPQV